MIDLKPFYREFDQDAIGCGTSKICTVMPEGNQQMYYCLVEGIEPGEIHYCEIEDYECRYVLPSAFDSIGKEPVEEQTPYTADAETGLPYLPLPPTRTGQRQEQPNRLTLDPPED